MMVGWIQVLADVSDNVELYLVILLFSLILHFFMGIKQSFKEIIDPLTLTLIRDSLAMAVPFYMIIANMSIDNGLLYNCVIEGIAFLFGFTIIAKLANRQKMIVIETDSTTRREKNILFVICVVLFISLKIIFFSVYGIPIFAFSNHVAAAQANGLISKITEAIFPIISILIVDRLFKRQYKSTLVVLIILIPSLLLSGSKSAFLDIFMGIFYYQMYAEKFNMKYTFNFRKFYVLALVVSFIGAILIMAANEGDNDNNIGDDNAIVARFAARLVGEGDGFADFYLNGVDEYMMNNNGLMNVVIEPLAATFRIIPRDLTAPSVNLQLNDAPISAEWASAPNFRYNMFSQICFGIYGGVFFSFLLGCLIAFVCRYLYKIMTGINTFAYYIFFSGIYLPIIHCIIDPMYGVDGVIFGILFDSLVIGAVFISKLCV